MKVYDYIEYFYSHSYYNKNKSIDIGDDKWAQWDRFNKIDLSTEFRKKNFQKDTIPSPSKKRPNSPSEKNKVPVLLDELGCEFGKPYKTDRAPNCGKLKKL